LSKLNYISLLISLLLSEFGQAQWFQQVDRKHEMFAGWGWNRASYSDSDIHFQGADYNFTLQNVQAKDRQTEFSAETYFGLKTMTIPQTNMRAGFFITPNLAITGGVDHMKYVMVQNQEVTIDGHIGDDTYQNMIDNNRIVLRDNFLTYEHTDGLNYINTELEYYQGIYHSKHLQFNAIGGAGFGAMLPKSNVKLMTYPRNDQFHLAGFGLSAKFAFEVLFWNHFFVRMEYKTGYINMPDVVTRAASAEDRASQQFFFAQRNGIFGFNFSLNKKPTEIKTTETNS
jgi:hypothetical protein